MKMRITASLFFAAVLITAAALAYEESTISSAELLFAPAPDGRIAAGKDNGGGRGIHHAGEDCGRCHRPGGRAEKHLFTIAGTLYGDRSAQSPLPGGEVILQDREGRVISMTSNRTGNFWTTAPIASDPYTVATTHGHEPFIPLYEEDEGGLLTVPADPDDPRTWKYKTWVRKGPYERPMVSIASVGGGSATTMRMGCSMHHGGVSHRSGALWVGKGRTLAFYPEAGLSYRKHIYPILRSNCAPCHVPGSTISPRNTKSDIAENSTAVDYSGGLDLMTYEGSSVETPLYHPTMPMKVIGYETISKRGVLSVVDTDTPEHSKLLQKTLRGSEPHGGGIFWSKRSADYKALAHWIAEGAQKN